MPKILTTSQVRMADEYSIKHEPISSVDLMERASQMLYEWIRNYLPMSRPVFVFAGPGNNGGDGLALARMLLEGGYNVRIYILRIGSLLSPDAEINLQRLSRINKSEINYIGNENQFPPIPKEVLIIDALFGSGLKKPIEGLAASLVSYLNTSGGEILAVDIPSGLFGEDNRDNPVNGIIRAKNTLTFQFPKLAFFFSENHAFVGNWHVLPIGLSEEFISQVETHLFYLSKPEVIGWIKNREKFDHKGDFGHALLFAGSKGKTGAAVLSAKACLKSGCGLITVHIPASGYEIFQSALPEAMCSIDPAADLLTSVPDLSNYKALGIGPGTGTQKPTVVMLEKILKTAKQPLVIDADGINILAENRELLNALPENSILTPHPGEFDRLTGKAKTSYERFLRQIEFSVNQKVIVVLKGAFSSVSTPDGLVYFNSTGNQGMATAGSGDVLTGIILSLLAQGYSSIYAALCGVYLHGLAGDLALKVESYESLIAGDIIDHIGLAFKELNNK